MGLFDSIKDAFTTDDGERLEAARKTLDKAKSALEKVKAEVGTAADPKSRERLSRAEEDVAAAQTNVNEFEAKVNGTPVAPESAPEPTPVPAEPVVDEAQAEADAEAIRNIEAMKAAEAEKAAAEQAAAEQAAAEQAAAEAQAQEMAAPAPEPELRTYTVVKGDNLTKIGKKFGVSWKSIAELNGISNPDLIHPGQVFKIPNA